MTRSSVCASHPEGGLHVASLDWRVMGLAHWGSADANGGVDDAQIVVISVMVPTVERGERTGFLLDVRDGKGPRLRPRRDSPIWSRTGAHKSETILQAALAFGLDRVKSERNLPEHGEKSTVMTVIVFARDLDTDVLPIVVAMRPRTTSFRHAHVARVLPPQELWSLIG